MQKIASTPAGWQAKKTTFDLIESGSCLGNDERSEIAHLIKIIEGALDGRMYFSVSEVSSLLGISTKTLKKHADLGNLEFARRGFGRKKVRRIFSVRDVARFCLRLSRGTAAVPRTSRGR